MCRHVSRGAGVIVEEPAQTLITADSAQTLNGRCAIDQFVRQALMIALAMVMRNDLFFSRS
jgi:hypothetical protein